MTSLKNSLICLALTISVLLVFWQVRDFGFVEFDDGAYIYENQHVLNGLTKDGVIWAFTTGHEANWHPATWLSLMLDCQWFGTNPGRMHLVNVFWHLANTLLLFGVLKRMTGSLWPSAFVAAAFALHPMHVQSVAWITERKDVLSTFFLLLTLAAYAGYVRRPSAFRYAAALLLFALGLMAKPMLVTLPFVLLLLDYWPLNRFEGAWPQKNSGRQAGPSVPATDNHSILLRLLIEKVPFIALSVVSSVITFLVQRGAMTPMDGLGRKDRIFSAAMAYFQYIKKLFWPGDLAVLYPLGKPGDILPGQFALCVLLLLGVTLLVLLGGRRRKYLPVGWFWFVGTLVPVIGLVQVGSQAYADRYTYIPYIGLFIMMAWGLPELVSRWPQRRAVLGVMMVGVLTASGLWAHRQTSYWKDGITLFSRTIEVTGNNAAIQNSLGVAYGRLGRYDEEIRAYQQAIRIWPGYAEAYSNLGAAYVDIGRHQEAIEACEQAIKLKPDSAEAYNKLGIVYGRLGRQEEAIEAYRQAIKLKPDYAKAHFNLGIAYRHLGRNDQAIEAYQQAIALKPDYAEAYNNLGAAYLQLGRPKEAIEVYGKAIRSRPNYAWAHYNLGIACAVIGRHQEAIEAYQQAIRIQPGNAEAHNKLAEAYCALGRHQEAIEAYRQAIRIKPDYAKAHNDLGLAYGTLGRYPEAAEAFGQTIRIQPENAEGHLNLGRACHVLGRYEEAIQAYQQAIRIKPQRADAHLSLGLACLAIGDTASATREHEILKTLDAAMADKLWNRIKQGGPIQP